jgi:tetratricopeptide (TPR) repeat protein
MLRNPALFLAGLGAAVVIALTSTTYAYASQSSSALVLEARTLLDTYFGERANLHQASQLLLRAHKLDDSDAETYVQAARLVIKGGHIVFSEYQPGTVEGYRLLLEKAIRLDPSNAKAHILMAEAASKTRDYSRMKSELDAASKLDTNDPWLAIGFGRYYWDIGDAANARRSFEQVQARGPGAVESHRNAYIAALLGLARMEPILPATDGLKTLALAARKDRHPKDAWTLGSFAEDFNLRGQFSDAIEFAKDALRTMNYGAGRHALAVALYGRAAQLVQQGEPDKANVLVKEAQEFGFSRDSILARFVEWNPAMNTLRPIVANMFQ